MPTKEDLELMFSDIHTCSGQVNSEHVLGGASYTISCTILTSYSSSTTNEIKRPQIQIILYFILISQSRVINSFKLHRLVTGHFDHCVNKGLKSYRIESAITFGPWKDSFIL